MGREGRPIKAAVVTAPDFRNDKDCAHKSINRGNAICKIVPDLHQFSVAPASGDAIASIARPSDDEPYGDALPLSYEAMCFRGLGENRTRALPVVVSLSTIGRSSPLSVLGNSLSLSVAASNNDDLPLSLNLSLPRWERRRPAPSRHRAPSDSESYKQERRRRWWTARLDSNQRASC